MKNAFDAQANLNEWIQNDWESDDYINHEPKIDSKSKRKTERNNCIPKRKTYLSVLAWTLAVVVTLCKSPLFWAAIFMLIIISE